MMSTAKVAEQLDVPEETVRRWRRHGTGPRHFRVGRHVRYDPRDVLAWIDQRRAETDRTDRVPA